MSRKSIERLELERERRHDKRVREQERRNKRWSKTAERVVSDELFRELLRNDGVKL